MTCPAVPPSPSAAKAPARGLWLCFCLLWAGASLPLAAEPGPATVRFRNTSTVQWQLKVSATAWSRGLRLLPGPDGRVPALTSEQFIQVPANEWIEVSWPMKPGIRKLAIPIAPDGKNHNPFSYRAIFRRSPGRLSVAMDSLYETPPGYVAPFTVEQNSVTITRSQWDSPPAEASSRSASSRPRPGLGTPDPAPSPSAFALPAQAIDRPDSGASGPAPSRKRKDPADGELPPALRPRSTAPVPEAQAPVQAPAEASTRLVKISNHSGSAWFLELEEAYDPHHPVVWKKDRHHVLRAVPPRDAENGELEVVLTPRAYYRIPAHGRRYLLLAARAVRLRARLWDAQQQANPFGVALVLTHAADGPVATFALADPARMDSTLDGLIHRTLGFGPEKLTLKTDGWDPVLVAADPDRDRYPGSPAARPHPGGEGKGPL